jgi:ferric-dicitrate binding protein FerR (iron transport regulator)
LAATVTSPAASAAPAPPRRRRSFAVPQVRGVMSWWPGAAAAAAVVLAAVALERSSAHEHVASEPPAGSYATATMQRAEIRLADGTRVRMAPASRLRVAADFGRERRDVYLEGEAYFDVVHDARPFTVYAGNASARDLGTAFSVRSYVEDSAVRVVVREGQVALSGVGRLAAGDVGRLTSQGVASLRHDADVDAMLAWLDGRHGFVDAPLGQVLRELARWYGTDVRLADSSLAALPFTGTVEGATPSMALDVVASTLGLTVHRDGGHTLLTRSRGRTPRASIVPR